MGGGGVGARHFPIQAYGGRRTVRLVRSRVTVTVGGKCLALAASRVVRGVGRWTAAAKKGEAFPVAGASVVSAVAGVTLAAGAKAMGNASPLRR